MFGSQFTQNRIKCKKGPVIIAVSAQFGVSGFSGYTGTVSLEKNLSNILSMRVLSVNISQHNGTLAYSANSGNLWLLQSSRLGSLASKNPFQIGTSYANPLSSTPVQACSTVIAIVQKTQANLAETSADTEYLNPEIAFCQSQQINFFDWSISLLQGTFDPTDESTVEIVFAFHPACNCDPF